MPRLDPGVIWSRLLLFRLDWIQVEVSARCDGDCLYCPVSRLRPLRENALMAPEVFEALLPFFPSADLVFLQGWGEPLLHPRFWEMARQAVSSGTRVGFTTNGRLLDRENRRALLDSGVQVLGVTLAGATPGTHDHFRRSIPLELLDRNLRSLREEKAGEDAGGPDLHIAYQLLAGNRSEVERVVELAERWGAAQIVVSPLSLVLSRELEDESLHDRPREWTGVVDLLREASLKAGERGIAFHAYRVQQVETEPVCRENVLNSCFVSAEGEVSPCVMANVGLRRNATATHRFRGEEHPLPTCSFGNVKERPLPQIWRSRAAREFRRAFRDRIQGRGTGPGGLPPPCRHCYKLFEP